MIIINKNKNIIGKMIETKNKGRINSNEPTTNTFTFRDDPKHIKDNSIRLQIPKKQFAKVTRLNIDENKSVYNNPDYSVIKSPMSGSKAKSLENTLKQ